MAGPRVKPGGWGFETVLTSGEITQLDANVEGLGTRLDVIDPSSEGARRIRSYATFAALEAVASPEDRTYAVVHGYGLYVFRASSPAAASLTPSIVKPEDGSAGTWAPVDFVSWASNRRDAYYAQGAAYVSGVAEVAGPVGVANTGSSVIATVALSKLVNGSQAILAGDLVDVRASMELGAFNGTGDVAAWSGQQDWNTKTLRSFNARIVVKVGTMFTYGSFRSVGHEGMSVLSERLAAPATGAVEVQLEVGYVAPGTGYVGVRRLAMHASIFHP